MHLPLHWLFKTHEASEVVTYRRAYECRRCHSCRTAEVVGVGQDGWFAWRFGAQSRAIKTAGLRAVRASERDAQFKLDICRCPSCGTRQRAGRVVVQWLLRSVLGLACLGLALWLVGHAEQWSIGVWIPGSFFILIFLYLFGRLVRKWMSVEDYVSFFGDGASAPRSLQAVVLDEDLPDDEDEPSGGEKADDAQSLPPIDQPDDWKLDPRARRRVRARRRRQRLRV